MCVGTTSFPFMILQTVSTEELDALQSSREERLPAVLCFAFQLEEPPAEHTFPVETQAM